MFYNLLSTDKKIILDRTTITSRRADSKEVPSGFKQNPWEN